MAGIRAVPLRFRSGAGPRAAQLLVGLEPQPEVSRRDLLARLGGWARSCEVSAAVLTGEVPRLHADFRALGFEDAGPLPRFFAPVRPGKLRRALTFALLPRLGEPSGIRAVVEPLQVPVQDALTERLASSFSLVAGPLPGAAGEALPGMHLLRGRLPVAGCRFGPPSGAAGVIPVLDWIAPPEEPEITAALAREALRAVSGAAAGISFETCHGALGRGLQLAGFLPRRSRARILIRFGSKRAIRTPRPDGWHLPGPARLSVSRCYNPRFHSVGAAIV